uniref:Protein MEMO1 n=1 Tax=Timema cristinae TaxID=61476 RepID=A0A7R9CCW0_TIMCR|nr:unnamed protein product [Timema cristinae]
MAVRRASHSGSWYSDSAKELNKQLGTWLNNADLSHGPARAIIAPRRVFILGPSHHVRLGGCALSTAVKYHTPLYDLRIDTQVYSDLEASNLFEWMNISVDEDEHSIEMHLPYIAKIMEDYKDSFTIVPVLVGSLSAEKEAVYGRVFSRYLADPQNLFVISSDFCHWGHRFRYTFYERSWGEIHQSVQTLDRMGMDAIESLDPAAFTDYLKKYGNTICGRHPIGVLLQTIHSLKMSGTNGHRMVLKFLKYAQSSQCCGMNDSSVSYASAALTFE